MTDLSFNSNSKFIIFCCEDLSMGLFNTKTKLVATLPREHSNKEATLCQAHFNYTDTMIASGASDGELIVYSLEISPDQMQIKTAVIFRDKSIKAPLTACRFSQTKQNVLATAYASGVIAMWDFK